MSDRVTDDVARKLLATTDAEAWADEFLAQPHIHMIDELDRDMIVTWFANAIETGRSHAGAMTLAHADRIAEAALLRAGGMGATVGGLFLATIMDLAKRDVDALASVVALFVGTRGYALTGGVDEAVFQRAAEAAMRVVESEPFEKLKRPG